MHFAPIGPFAGPGPFPFVLIPLFWLLVLGAIAFAVVRARRRDRETGPGTVRSAEGVLADRFARGDIGEDEFRTRLEVLRAEAPARRRR